MWLQQTRSFIHRLLGAMRRRLAKAASLSALRSIRDTKPDARAGSGADNPEVALGATRTLRIEFLPRDCRPPRELDAAIPDDRALGLGLHRFRVQAVGQRRDDQGWLDTSQSGHGLQYLGAGWCSPEPWGIWGRGSRHSLDLVLPDANSDSLLLVDAHASLAGSRKQLTVDVVVGGQLTFAWTFSTHDNRNIRSIRIPATAIASLATRHDQAMTGTRPELWTQRACAEIPTDQVRSILAIKVDHVGDFILSLESMLRLREAFRNASIDLLCAPWNGDLAEASGIFRKVYTTRFLSERADQVNKGEDQAITEIGSDPANATWDIAIDLRVDPDTRVLLKSINATYKFGFDADPSGDSLALSFPRPNMYSASINQQFMMLTLVHGVIEFFHPTSESSVLLKSLIGVPRLEYFNGIKRNLVAVNTGSGRAAKNWPIERFIEIVSWLIDEMNAHVVLVGSGDQESHARHIIDNLNSPNITSLVGRTTVREAISIVADTKLYVGNDSGLTHAAARIGVPTVAIYSGIDPVAVWAPIGPHVTVIRAPVHCSPCHIRMLTECRNRHACILSIDTQFVKDVLTRVFTEIDGRSEADPRCSRQGIVI